MLCGFIRARRNKLAGDYLAVNDEQAKNDVTEPVEQVDLANQQKLIVRNKTRKTKRAKAPKAKFYKHRHTSFVNTIKSLSLLHGMTQPVCKETDAFNSF